MLKIKKRLGLSLRYLGTGTPKLDLRKTVQFSCKSDPSLCRNNQIDQRGSKRIIGGLLAAAWLPRPQPRANTRTGSYSAHALCNTSQKTHDSSQRCPQAWSVVCLTTDRLYHRKSVLLIGCGEWIGLSQKCPSDRPGCVLISKRNASDTASLSVSIVESAE